MKFWYAGLLPALLMLGGCATKNEVQSLQGDIGAVQAEWRAFAAGYDPAMREELHRNLDALQALNDEIAALRDESRRNAERVQELLGMIEHNELERAVAACREMSTNAARFAEMAHIDAQNARQHSEEAQHAIHMALRYHVEAEHRIDDEELLSMLRRLQKRVKTLEAELDARRDERNH